MLSPIEIGPHRIDAPVLLAPMAGITDAPFRRQVRRFGVGLVASEMIASQEMAQDKRGAREKSALSEDDGVAAVQIAGRDAYWMGEAARIAEAAGAAIVDINMGCPAKKVTNGYSGSALMRTPDHALRLIEAVVAAVSVPVTLKTRLGWDRTSLNAPQIARRAEEAGVRAITIHGRTRCDFYKGEADWAAIRAVKDAVSVPLIANGDVVDAASARKALGLSGADGVMIGRAAQGRPWVVGQIRADLVGASFRAPNRAEEGALMIEHYEALLSRYGATLGLRCARKHFGWRLAAHAGGPELRNRLVRMEDPAEVIRAIAAFFETEDARWAA